MKNIPVSKQYALMIILGYLLIFSACKKDDPIINLSVDKTETEVFSGESVLINITSGSGNYSVNSSSDAVARADVAGQSIRIIGASKGAATITVKDGAGKTATISVSVKSAIIDASTPRFKWENTVELDVSNGWATTVLSNRVAITNLADKKQYVLMWTGDYTVGDKTEAKLRILESGKDARELTLTTLEVQRAENNLYSIIFSSEGQNGELVFKK